MALPNVPKCLPIRSVGQMVSASRNDLLHSVTMEGVLGNFFLKKAPTGLLESLMCEVSDMVNLWSGWRCGLPVVS